MGRVPAPEELLAGRIAPVPQHREAGRYALGLLFPERHSLRSELDNAPLFHGGMVYGSSIDGPQGPNLRSDLDLLVISAHEGSRENEAKAVLDTVMSEVENRFLVRAEQKLFSPGVPNDDVDPLYAQHIVDVGKRYPEWCVNDPSK